jgi:hypothetical protein
MIYARGYMQGKHLHYRTKQENPTLSVSEVAEHALARDGRYPLRSSSGS